MISRICLIFAMVLTTSMAVLPQRGRQRENQPATRPNERAAPPVTPEPKQPVAEPSPDGDQQSDQQDLETLKINTTLVTVPVIATTIQGNYIPDLRQEEFSISEDGEKQEIAFFATVSAPFHVVLMLDTSASTEEKLRSIQKAAAAFVEQLQTADRVKIISFDTEIRDLSEFTSDRAVLRDAIYKTTSGQGTRLYDAFEVALSSIRRIQGRKAIVLFSDGVDWHSDDSTFDKSLRGLDEEGVIVYPIRYDTRADTERIVQKAQDDAGSTLPTIDVIRRVPDGTTAPTFPSDDPSTVPTSGRTRTTGPLGLPSAAEIMRGGRRPRDPNTDRYPDPDRGPTRGPTSRPDREPGDVGASHPDPNDIPGSSGRGRTRRTDDSTDLMLDNLYATGDSYLLALADNSGGRLLRADTLGSLPDAFAKIAAELRTQYAIGYYPIKKTRDGQYRKIKVKTTRKNVAVRARPGYRAPSGG
jgi:hypothetical protein